MLDGGTISGLLPWDEARRLYYVELRYDGAAIVPGGSTSYRREAQFRLAVPSALGSSAWNPSNDFSYNGLLVGNNNVQRSTFIPTYENGVKLEGVEPPLSDAYSLWRESTFSAAQRSDAAISGPNADPDGDGLANLFEYGLGSSPFEPDPDLSSTSEFAGGVLSLIYKRPDVKSDLVYRVEWSDSLADGSWSSSGVRESNLGVTGGIRTIRAAVPSVPGVNRRFARVIVSTIPAE
jgi:hypothetical protein